MSDAVTAGGGASGDATAATKLESFSYDDAIVRMFLAATVLWAVVAMLVGVVVGIQLAFPQANLGLPFTSFGRLRPLHTNAAIFAFGGNAIFAAVYYSTQRLCKARMYCDTLSRIHFWGWQGIIVAAALTLPAGITQGKEYAELAWPIDIAIAVVWLVIFGWNFVGTLMRRRERHMYVALWFYLATLVTITVLHVFNSLVLPFGLFDSYPIYAGVQDAFMQWWYGHNAVGFFLTTPFLGLMYYFLPKAAGRPVYSYRLSIVHFWALVFIYIWAGPHHLHYTALPEWASTLGMVFSVMLIMPSWAGMMNGLLTLRGAWKKVAADPVLKFFAVAVTFYGMATFEGSMMSVKSVNSLSHYTDWTIGHVHSGALGWVGFLSFGMVYWLLPRLYQTKLWSPKMANAHFWIATIGILLYIVSMYVAGIAQGLMWRGLDDAGRLTYPNFLETVTSIIPMYWVRAIGGTLYLVGAIMCGVNYVMTWRTRPATYEVPVHEAPPLSKAYQDPAPSGAGMTWGERIKSMRLWGDLSWHRRWERLPGWFSVAILVAVLTATAFEAIPTFLIKSNVPTIASVQPYTPLELAGRDIYISEGCYNCHSQMIRPMLAEKKRYGEYSKPGEFIYDRPFQWGSRRIGPDLAREGGKQSNLWHALHFKEPDKISKGTIMPPYPWLLENELDFASIPRRVKAMATLGVPYGEELERAEEMARAQAAEIARDIERQNGPKGLADKEVVALIAYLQRLGTDLFKAAPAGGGMGAQGGVPADAGGSR
jgi:cytochrome c oxidase cbb3-type subunit I/II